ncbi:SBBP repeat-containing protein [Methanothermobacter wolfeii]|uniref:SBBP repeat-containing protein n=1 Tax=Methanothermobacter wolfeii TaxID=145261 RepID=A0ABU8TWP2_METWO|nr:SBBP repeat-containing protein [Methanothermobacter sp. THM-1]SCM55596.1 putative cell surface glycoprotein [Methanothermobacter wolfeii]
MDSTLTIKYLTYMGGSSDDYVKGIVLDDNSNIYITGYTYSTDFPVTWNALQDNKRGQADIFLARFTPEPSLSYSTYIGGSGKDQCHSITSKDGNIYLAGKTDSNDFPVTSNAYQKTIKGGCDGFITIINGNGLITYSTYLEGVNNDEIQSIKVDALGNIYVTGTTNSTNFPLTNNAYDRNMNTTEAFITKIRTEGIHYSTYLGGSSLDEGYTVAVDRFQNIYAGGTTRSPDFPVSPDAHKKPGKDLQTAS